MDGSEAQTKPLGVAVGRRRKGAVKQCRAHLAGTRSIGAGGQAFEYMASMTDPADRQSVPPLKLAAASGTAVLCAVIVFNALVNQDGRQRDVLTRLSDLEVHGTLPVTVGVGRFQPRPTTKTNVTIGELAELAAAKPTLDPLALEMQRELAELGLYDGPLDGQNSPRLRQAIEAYEDESGLDVTGQPTARLLERVRLTRHIRDASRPNQTAGVDVRTIQEGLARLGYSPGPGDGQLGPQTREAIRRFERDRNLLETGTITEVLAQEVTRVLGNDG